MGKYKIMNMVCPKCHKDHLQFKICRETSEFEGICSDCGYEISHKMKRRPRTEEIIRVQESYPFEKIFLGAYSMQGHEPNMIWHVPMPLEMEEQTMMELIAYPNGGHLSQQAKLYVDRIRKESFCGKSMAFFVNAFLINEQGRPVLLVMTGDTVEILHTDAGHTFYVNKVSWEVTESNIKKPVKTGFWKNTPLCSPEFQLDEIELESADPVVMDGINLDWFLHGNCSIAALALHEKYGYEIMCLYDKDEADESGVGPYDVRFPLVHDFCYDPERDLYIDVRGIVSDKEAFCGEFEDFFTTPCFVKIEDANRLKETIIQMIPEKEYQVLYKAVLHWIEGHENMYKI